jgi:outer membrane protein, heavy metal efflux system
MTLVRTVRLCAVCTMVAACCSTNAQTPTIRFANAPALPADPVIRSQGLSSRQASMSTGEMPVPADSAKASDPQFDEANVLTLPQLIEEVQDRNPSLAAMTAAWQAAAQRYPQVTALEDPTFMAMGAPASFGSDQVESAYALQLNQKVPWFGKRAARGRQAQAETNAAFHDLEDSRVRLAQMTGAAFFDYYLAIHHMHLNRENVELIGQFHSTAEAKYDANQVTQQDVLQADVELAQLERRRIELERMTKVSIARINTLLQKDPSSPLPPPPSHLDPPTGAMDSEALQQLAFTQRPDLAALADKVRADEAAVTLACKDYYPDAEVFGRYDTFWQPASTQSDLRPQVGVTINVPIYRGRLNAAVREATFKLNQQQAEYEQHRLDIQYEVASAYEEVEETRKTLRLYADKLVPATEQNVAAARSNYDVNRVSFLELATAQRQLIELREAREEALASYHSRLAELTRAVGGSIPTTAALRDEESAPPKQ